MSVAALLLLAIPFAAFAVLFALLYRWGEKHDPMERSKLQFLTPGQSREDDPRG